ncbi:hypothetical protein ANCCAN_22415 [Ancylostoma caninum]|uniref:G-protein coupled receptors family 1 profile domain-containing protein n=1 Tax=Ancylostoma caninum TaxID=29170 RepID=A0A368FJS4_ANCCA|nr:hypothetical protein ANCCAN_22415 [Ancylostoma caninum]
MCFSSILLLNVAVDRLMSLHKFYHILVNIYKNVYVGTQVSIAATIPAALTIWIFSARTTDRDVVCFAPAVMDEQRTKVFVSGLLILNIIILACYGFFLRRVRKIRICRWC